MTTYEDPLRLSWSTGGFRFRDSGVEIRVSGFGFRDSGFGPGFGFMVFFLSFGLGLEVSCPGIRSSTLTPGSSANQASPRGLVIRASGLSRDLNVASRVS